MPENIKLLFYELKCQINNNCKSTAARTLERLKENIETEFEKKIPYGLRSDKI